MKKDGSDAPKMFHRQKATKMCATVIIHTLAYIHEKEKIRETVCVCVCDPQRKNSICSDAHTCAVLGDTGKKIGGGAYIIYGEAAAAVHKKKLLRKKERCCRKKLAIAAVYILFRSRFLRENRRSSFAKDCAFEDLPIKRR